LVLVRDRFGKKPLYFRNWRGDIAFGSRFDTIEALTDTAVLSEDALSWLLTLKYIPEPFSAAKEIQKVPAGHLIKIHAGKQELMRWYAHQPDANAISFSLSDQQKQLYSRLEQAVAERLVSDVPVACFLSGGIDSAIIASLSKKHGPIDTFTMCFEDSHLDERQMARATAEFLGTNHHELRIKNDDQLIMIDQLFGSALDEPFGDSSALPSLFVSNAIKNYATVALSGDGADELFGGYQKYQGELAVHTWCRLPRPLRLIIKTIINSLPHSHTNSWTDKFRQLRRFVTGAEFGNVNRHASWMEVASSEPDIIDIIGPRQHDALVKILNQVALPSVIDPLSATLLRDMETVLVSDMLVKVDRTSMDNGLEVRSPFLDHRVASMSLAIEGNQKVAWGKGKKILRDIFKNDLPQQLFTAPKRGFEMPLNKWLLGPLSDQLNQALSPEFLSFNKLNPKLAETLHRGITRGQLPHAELGWTLMSIYRWQESRQSL
jgi:asparagine synthase (glutamine-hydrolysing)